MSDLLAPLLYVFDDEVDAFWCFVAYMERVVSVKFIDPFPANLFNSFIFLEFEFSAWSSGY